MPIFFYLPGDEYGWLSNFSRHGVELPLPIELPTELATERPAKLPAKLAGEQVAVWWPTVEHYFQAAKFATTAVSYAEKIRQVRHPRDAKRLGNDRSQPLRADWEQVKDSVMQLALRKKFMTHPRLHERLLASGTAKLVERAPHDRYWGSGQDGTGLNRLGTLLMQVRRELRALPAPADKAARPKRKRR